MVDIFSPVMCQGTCQPLNKNAGYMNVFIVCVNVPLSLMMALALDKSSWWDFPASEFSRLVLKEPKPFLRS